MVLIFLFPALQAVSADGIIIPDPPPCRPPECQRPVMEQLDVRYHNVTVEINNQIAVTKVDQVFFNPNDYTVEGTYTFPLPPGAVVTNFKLWIDGKEVQGKVLDASAARQQYEEIVRTLRDPALLEYVSNGAVTARIFPIPPQGERRIQLEYTQVLTANLGLVEYRYPLNTEKFSNKPLENVTVNVKIISDTPVNGVYSPSHSISVDKSDPKAVTAGYEAKDTKPDTDFLLYYSVGTEEGLHLLTYRNPADTSDPDGFFVMLVTPPSADPDRVVAKDVVMVIDHSGSMDGEKFRQAQNAVHFILQHLNEEDHFNIVSFSTAVDLFAPSMQMTSQVGKAEAWVDQISPGGSTDINTALLDAIKSTNSERPTYVVFLTDGLPTHGEVKSQSILGNVAAAVTPNIRLFSFGVGYDVDTSLLDTLSLNHHGSSTYVAPGQSVDEVINGFYQRISTPALTDLNLKATGLTLYDITPNPLPDLFYGSQIVITGRYKDGGTADLVLSGKTDSGEYLHTFSGMAFVTGKEDGDGLTYISRLWASRKIGSLLTQIRLNGPDQETIQQIIQISIRYGIVTPYTSYLVTEPDALSDAAQQRIARQEYQSQAAAPSAVSGAGAVNKAADQGAMSSAESVPAPSASQADVIKMAGSRTFVLRDGVWTDTRFDPDKMQTRKVKYLSDEYFQLAASNSDLAAGLAIGEKVILVNGSDVIEIVE
jgi:Ca-activated chloride channel family protein